MKLERLVIGVDFSTHSIEAARWAANQFAPGAEVVLLHVIPEGEAPQAISRRASRHDLSIDTVRGAAEKRLREIGRSLNADFVWREVLTGNPAECLARVAAEFWADLVVVGATGDQPGAWQAFGTTAEHLVRMSTRPVLLVTYADLTLQSHLLVPADESDGVTGHPELTSTTWRSNVTGATAVAGVSRVISPGDVFAVGRRLTSDTVHAHDH